MTLHPIKDSSGAQRGFTLVELIVVIVIVGILGAVAAARFAGRGSFDTAAHAEQVRSLLRYGQKLAVAQNRPVYVRLNGKSVGLCFAPGCAVADRVQASEGKEGRTANDSGAADPDYCGAAPWACVDNPVSGSYTSATSLFYFDALGKPYMASDSVTGTTSSFATLVILFNDSTGDDAQSVRTATIESETGYVH